MANTIQNAVASANNAPAEKKSINQIMSAMLDGEGIRKRFDELLGSRSAQFVSSIVSLVNASPEMQAAFYESPMSVIQAGLRAASYDLPIDQSLGYAYIVPFKNNKKNDDGTWSKRSEATFMLGWKGMHQLASRAGVYKVINVVDVREGELKYYNRLTEETDVDFIEDEDEREAKKVVGYLGYYRLVNGAEKTIYRTIKQLDNHEIKFRKGGYESKLHKDDPDSYYRKTVYRELIGKWGVMSIDYQTSKAGMNLANAITEELASDKNNRIIIDVDTATGEVTDNE